MSVPRQLSSALVVAGLLVAVTACGGGTSASGALASVSRGSTAPGAAAPSVSSSDHVSCTDAGPIKPGGSNPENPPSPIVHSSDAINVLGGQELLPAAFPIPPGVTVRQVLQVRGVAVTAELAAGDLNAAYQDLLTALPGHGYRIDLCQRTPGEAGIGFSGPGCGAGSVVSLAPSTSAVDCTQA